MDIPSSRIQTFLSAQKKILAQPFWVRLCALAILLLVGWVATCSFFVRQHKKLKTLSTEVEVLVSLAEALEKQKGLYAQMKEQMARAPGDYVKKTVEGVQLLKGERLRAAALAKQFPDNISLRERLQFLASDQNHICFDTAREGTGVQLRLRRRVQMDGDDLRKFLELVEGDRYDATQGRPLLVMKKFDLLKCYEKGDEKVYSIDAELIQQQ
jgi:hypothetical protein